MTIDRVINTVLFCVFSTVALAVEEDPLDKVYAYSLQLTPDGPKEGYFPIGARPGLPLLAVHTGFNVHQPTTTFTGFKKGQSFGPLSEDAEGQRYHQYSTLYGSQLYVQLRAGLALRRGNPAPPHDYPRFGYIGASVQADGTVRKGVPDSFSPNLRRYLLSYVEEGGRAYGSSTDEDAGKYTHMWGMDNEWEGVLEYSENARSAYAKWLEAVYAGDVRALNEAWGTNFANMEEAFAVWPPSPDEFNTRPGEFLDWHTFQSEYFTGLLADMAVTLHNADPLHRPVVYKSTQQTTEYPYVNRRKVFNHEIFAEKTRAVSGGLYGINMYGSGDRESYEISFIFNAIRPDDPDDDSVWGVMIPEMNNHSGPGHQWAATFWRVLANGLKAANLFCMGYEGAKGDYDTFGMFSPEGYPRDKLFYAARWAHALHRMEPFWRLSKPSPEMPRVAILMPRRDIILSERTDRRVSRWAYPSNHRVFVYGWLRELGYWVDVIPYSKLTDTWLPQYDAVFLIGAEHLTEKESEALRKYVRNGGVLVADERSGFYDEHHRERQWLRDVLGLRLKEADKSVRYRIPEKQFIAKGRYDLQPETAEILLRDERGNPLVTRNHFGKGQTIHFAMELGATLDRELGEVEVSNFQATGGETADGEPIYDAGTHSISSWLSTFLDKANIPAGVRAIPGEWNPLGLLRVEQPFVDAKGNVAVVVATRGLREKESLKEGVPIEIRLPGGPWHQALWAPAEHAGLEPLAVEPVDEQWHRIVLPRVETAGVLYFLKDHRPLISLPQLESERRSRDGFGPLYEPGETFVVNAVLHNPGRESLPEGHFRILVRNGWELSEDVIDTPPLAPGETFAADFLVSVPEDAQPNWLHPLVVYWNDGTEDRAIMAANVEVAAP